jgi:nucleoside-diphosphate-sugar epimerase
MIVGRGLLASAFEPHFARNPGVSNSLETSVSEFVREDSLLRQSLDARPKRLVYFGSCGVASKQDVQTPYMQHKKRMESLVLGSPGGLVIRLPQIVGPSDNSHTLTNFLRDRILSGEHFMVWSRAERNLIDIDDVANIGVAVISELHESPSMMSIAARKSLPMPEIISIFERTLGKPANCSMIEKGSSFSIDTTLAAEISKRLEIDLGDGYMEKVIRKYYTP